MRYIPVGPSLGYTFQEHTLLIELKSGTLAVSLLVHGSVRVDLLKLGQYLLPSYALQTQWAATPWTNIEESDTEIKLHTAWGYVMVQLSPQVCLSYHNRTGEVLMADDPALSMGWQGEKPAHYKVLQSYERFVGLGEKTGPLDKWGRAYRHANTDAFAYGADTDPIYASIPFYMGMHSGRIYGLFYDSTWVSEVNFGASNHRFSSFVAEGGPLTYHFIYGQDAKEILSTYCHLTGYMNLPPMWSLGLQQCRYSYYPDATVLQVVENYRRRGIPLDVIYLDIHYMQDFKVFTWHETYFPDPAALIQKLTAMGVKVVVIMDPGIRQEPGYAPYDTLIEAGAFLQYPDGKPWTASVWPGNCLFPDFTDVQARTWWAGWMKDLATVGIAGFWNDMNEPASWGQSVPALVEFTLDDEDGVKHSMLEGRNVYGMQMARATQEGSMQHYPERRPFVLTRAAYAGTQRYAAIWTGDNTASVEHLMLGARLVANLGLAGMPFAGVDIGGFIGEADPALFARWVQVGCFSPLMRIHGMIDSRPGEPWAYGERVEAIATQYIRLRYQLLPYLYAAFREAARRGTPVARSLVLEQPHNPLTYDHRYQNQYGFGHALLVIPCHPQQPFTGAWLPPHEGGWCCFYTGQHYKDNQEIPLASPTEQMPVLVRAGSVFYMQSLSVQGKADALQHTGQSADELILHLYAGTGIHETTYYEDEGDGYGYQHGHCLVRKTMADHEARKLHIHAALGSYISTYKTLVIVLHGIDAKQVMVNGNPVFTEPYKHQLLADVPQFDPLGYVPPASHEKALAVSIDWQALAGDALELLW